MAPKALGKRRQGNDNAEEQAEKRGGGGRGAGRKKAALALGATPQARQTSMAEIKVHLPLPYFHLPYHCQNNQ